MEFELNGEKTKREKGLEARTMTEPWLEKEETQFWFLQMTHLHLPEILLTPPPPL